MMQYVKTMDALARHMARSPMCNPIAHVTMNHLGMWPANFAFCMMHSETAGTTGDYLASSLLPSTSDRL